MTQETGSHLTNVRSGVEETILRRKSKCWRIEMRPGSGRSLGRPLCCSSVEARRGFSLLSPRGRPKSPAAPSALIYEMASKAGPEYSPKRVPQLLSDSDGGRIQGLLKEKVLEAIARTERSEISCGLSKDRKIHQSQIESHNSRTESRDTPRHPPAQSCNL